MLVYHASYFGDLQLTWMTYVFSLILLDFFWSFHGSLDEIKPARHDNSLSGMSTLTSLIGKWIFNMICGFVVVSLIHSNPDYFELTFPDYPDASGT